MVRKNASNKELQNIGIKIKESKVTYLDKKGLQCGEPGSVVRISELQNGDNIYYIKYYRGELFDPYGIDERKIDALDIRYRKVDKYIFDSYVKYLNTRRTAYLSEARRDFIRKGY